MGMCTTDHAGCGSQGWTRLGRIAFPREMPERERRRLISRARCATVGMTDAERASFIALAFCGVPVSALAECTGEPAVALYRAKSEARARRRTGMTP
ncbi:MAG: hypothetical protein QOF68_1718, partial [Gaiellales bacterium]|nr:hypothetical protein [Gaiellales bacterium]